MNLVPKHVLKIAAKENSWAEYSSFRNKQKEEQKKETNFSANKV